MRLWNIFTDYLRPKKESTMKIASGGFSTVYRVGNDRQTVRKKPLRTLSKTQRQVVVHNYNRQKDISDRLRSRCPQNQTHLFTQIYQVKPDGQCIMKDLGNTDLLHLRLDNPEIVLKNLDHIVEQLYSAFLIMTREHVFHLDIKPENIMARKNPKTKKYDITFIDFGNSKLLNETTKDPEFDTFGTLLYMSPQLLKRKCASSQNRSKRSQYRSGQEYKEYLSNDLWSLGMVIYFLIYGLLPIHQIYGINKVVNCRVLYEFYNDLQNQHIVYEDVFPQKNIKGTKHLKDVRMLLSLNPETRLSWLSGKFQQQLKTKKQNQQKKTSK